MGRSARWHLDTATLGALLLCLAVSPARAEAALPASNESAREVDARWDAAIAIEQRMFEEQDVEAEQLRAQLDEAAALFLSVAEAKDGRNDAYWHASRATWLSGELLPLDDTEGRLEHFREGQRLADLGLAADPECAECMLWKFTAMGRLRTTASVFEGLRQIKDMARLLDEGIELEPDYRDNDLNSTLGNLHYASAVFYRIVPDWFWVRWVIGVRGDKERALDHSEKALALHPTRLDYQIEVGTQLLCLGSTKRKHRERLEEGRVVLTDAISRLPANADEQREIVFARKLLEDPERACGYSGDKLLEIDEDSAKQADA